MPDDPTPARDRPWQRAGLTGLGTWAVAAVAYLAVGAFYWSVDGVFSPGLRDLLGVWNRWDTGHYLRIAAEGYDPAIGNPAFFPLYPILIAYLNALLPGSGFVAALTISSVATIAGLTISFRLAEDLFDTGVARRTAAYLMVFPFGFFLVAAYNESLFVALTVASLYCLRRGSWAAAAVWAALASATRTAGVLLLLPFALEYLRQHGWRLTRRGVVRGRLGWDAATILLAPVGLLGYLLYDWVTFGDPLLPMHAQDRWGRGLAWPWTGATESIRAIADYLAINKPFHPGLIVNLIDVVPMALVLVLLVLSVVGPWRLGPEAGYLVAYGIASFLVILIVPMAPPSPPLHGIGRFTLENLAVFLVLARIGQRPGLDRAYLGLGAALQAVLLLAFFHNLWLA